MPKWGNIHESRRWTTSIFSKKNRLSFLHQCLIGNCFLPVGFSVKKRSSFGRCTGNLSNQNSISSNSEDFNLTSDSPPYYWLGLFHQQFLLKVTYRPVLLTNCNITWCIFYQFFERPCGLLTENIASCRGTWMMLYVIKKL